MILIKRWAYVLSLSLINTELFGINNWEFWVLALAIGFSSGNLFDSNKN